MDPEAELGEVEAAIAGVADDLAGAVQLALQKALRSPVWDWEDGTRDIVDTGRLASSGLVTASAKGINVTYTVPYANLVHNGGYIYPYGNKDARPIYMPGRPWITSVLYGGGPVEKFDFDGWLKDRLG